MTHTETPYVLTGYESILAVRASDKFVISATDSGVVESVSKSAVVVRYAGIGKKKYALKEWTTKEEAGVTYKHKLITNVKKGDKVTKDDTLAYDPAFFAASAFDNKRVIYRQGSSVCVALMEAPESYEDSGSISTRMSKRMSTVVTKVKSITLHTVDNVVDPLVVGDKTEPGTVVLSIVDQILKDISGLDDRALDTLKGIKRLSPKIGYNGMISKIVIYYNSDIEDLTPSLRKLVDISDAILMASSGVTGKVDSGYSIKGVPLQPGDVEIKYYVDTKVGMGTGDKAIYGNQLKFTVGEVYDTEIVSEDGVVVDGIFSTRSIEARIVNSPGLIGTTSKLLEVLGDKVVNDYFG